MRLCWGTAVLSAAPICIRGWKWAYRGGALRLSRACKFATPEEDEPKCRVNGSLIAFNLA